MLKKSLVILMACMLWLIITPKGNRILNTLQWALIAFMLYVLLLASLQSCGLQRRLPCDPLASGRYLVDSVQYSGRNATVWLHGRNCPFITVADTIKPGDIIPIITIKNKTK